jgi:hypothetical protein
MTINSLVGPVARRPMTWQPAFGISRPSPCSPTCRRRVNPTYLADSSLHSRRVSDPLAGRMQPASRLIPSRRGAPSPSSRSAPTCARSPPRPQRPPTRAAPPGPRRSRAARRRSTPARQITAVARRASAGRVVGSTTTSPTSHWQ